MQLQRLICIWMKFFVKLSCEISRNCKTFFKKNEHASPFQCSSWQAFEFGWTKFVSVYSITTEWWIMTFKVWRIALYMWLLVDPSKYACVFVFQTIGTRVSINNILFYFIIDRWKLKKILIVLKVNQKIVKKQKQQQPPLYYSFSRRLSPLALSV